MVDVTSLFGLDGRVAIVTGASSGIGDRMSRVLADAGATVVASARRLDRLETLASDDAAITPVACDVTIAADRERLVATTLRAHGQIDILVNNAGITTVVPAEDETLESWHAVVDTNLTATFHLSQLAGRAMLERRSGAIVNVASILGMVASGKIKQASYTASKGAVINLTRELAAQWARKGIRVNALCPGWFPTEMTEELFDGAKGEDWMARNTPMGRPGEIHELDGAVLFLAGDASSFVTGAVLAVDGGWTGI
jgi:NAD(P)-dependent dehydrogenase (short-subunit alcohol dehydrogenase family)